MTAGPTIETAHNLCREANLADPVEFTRLSGGKNNQVYRVDLADDKVIILKKYYVDPRDPRDRLQAEKDFLSYAWSRGVHNVPLPIAFDHENAVGLLSFVNGRKLNPYEITQAHIKECASFVAALNRLPRDMLSLIPASEACFSTLDHIRTVDRRVARLAYMDYQAPHYAEAKLFVDSLLKPLWLKIRSSLITIAEQDKTHAQQCVSPSDFGFHNALFDQQNGLSFIDFEYAGRDDIAKLICDFFCCPEIPTPKKFFYDFLDLISGVFEIDRFFLERCETLLNWHKVKWACIVLNDFLPQEVARRDFSLVNSREERCAEQIKKAQLIAAEIRME